MAHESLVPEGPQFCGSVSLSATENHQLCQGGVNPEESTRSQVSMETDSETMLHQGVALAAKTFQQTAKHLGWERPDIRRFVTHQVGSAHRRLLFEKT